MDIRIRRREVLIGGALALGVGGCEPQRGMTLPSVDLPGLAGLITSTGWPVPGISSRDFVGRVTLLNVWASWCPYCQAEHEWLMRLSQDKRFRLAGLVFRDTAAKAVGYLRRAGNPFGAVSLDDGTLTSALRQKGVPASYVVDRASRLVLKIPGELGDAAIRDRLMPAILSALDGAASPAG